MELFTPTDQQEELTDQVCKWFHDYENGHRIRNHPQWFSYSGAAGTGKAIPDNELLPTPNGFVRADSLQVGDYLFDANGKPTKILGVYPQSLKRVYKLVFEDGREARCSIDHLWEIYDNALESFDIVPLGRFVTQYKDKNHKYYNAKIRVPGKVEFNHIDVDIDPWVLGYFLVNGYHSNSIYNGRLVIRSKDKSIIASIVQKMNFGNSTKFPNSNWGFTWNNGNPVYINEVFNDILDTHNKTAYIIPESYLINDIYTRESVLSGIFAGSKCINRNEFVINVTSKALAYSIVQLGRSLSYLVFIKRTLNGYRVKLTKNHTRSDAEVMYTKSIIKLDDMVLMRCFYVDNPDHLFITGEFVPTHNTTVLSSIIDKLGLDDDQYMTCAYTGKAALNLQQKGLPSSTVHSLIYHTVLEKIKSSDEEIDAGDPPVKMRFHFILKDALPSNLRLIVVDEATMINNDMRDKILSFGLPVIFIGDMNQLPPIFGMSEVMLNPDFVLTKIMRQSEGNPIVQLANLILNDQYYDLGDYGNSKVVDSIEYSKGLLTDYDMILCGKNKTRDNMNNLIIHDILKKKSLIPFIGAKVVNRQNNWNLAVNGISLTNGLVGYITNFSKKTAYKGYYTIDFQPDFMDDEFEGLHIDTRYIVSDYNVRKNFGFTKFEKFEYAYCISTHISQGSQYNRVLFLDEVFPDAETTKKLRYTAITRAIDSIIIVRSKSYANRNLWCTDSYNDYRRMYS